MQNTAHRPVLRPATSSTSWTLDNDASSAIALPPPTTPRNFKSHQRSRTTVDLPPLFARTPSVSPTRSSTFLPFLRSARDRSISPERVSAKEAAEYEVTTPPEEGSDKLISQGKVEKLASWFDGSSDPVRISVVPSSSKGIPNPQIQEDSMAPPLFSASTESVDTFTRRPQKRPALSSNPTQMSSSRFNFFRKTSQAQIKPDILVQDELAQLDIKSTLFPTGVTDEFSPAAFKNLQMNAEGTIIRLQNAYKDNLQALKAMTSKKNIQVDELDAAKTRNEHLKLQLTDMAEKAADQERTIAALREELAMERRRMERQNIRLVTTENYAEGLATPKRPSYRKNRVSDASTSNESEAGSELSSAASVFSEPMTADYSPGTSVSASPVLRSAIMFKPPTSPRREHVTLRVIECGKCRVVNPSDAGVVEMLQAESMGLKTHIEKLEGALDDALDLVNGLTLDVGTAY